MLYKLTFSVQYYRQHKLHSVKPTKNLPSIQESIIRDISPKNEQFVKRQIPKFSDTFNFPKKLQSLSPKLWDTPFPICQNVKSFFEKSSKFSCTYPSLNFPFIFTAEFTLHSTTYESVP